MPDLTNGTTPLVILVTSELISEEALATYNIHVLPPNLLAKLIGETQLLGKTSRPAFYPLFLRREAS